MIEEIKKENIIKLNRMKTREICKRSFLIVLLILGLLCWYQGARAQNYPTRPISLVINSRPGAGTDMASRLIAEEAKKILGQEIIPVNKTGGGGTVGVAAVANSKPDGYTIGATTTDQFIYHPQLEAVGYDYKDFTYLTQMGEAWVAILVRSDSPYKSFKELIDFARNNPGKVSYGPPQFGTAPHLAMEYVVREEKVNIAMIPFEGSVPAVTSLLGGHITACGITPSVFMPHLKAGKVRLLAVIEEKRIQAVPDVPSLVELGYPLGGAFTTAYIMMAPKGTPPDISKTLTGALRKGMETTEFINYAKSSDLYVENPMSGEDIKRFIEVRYPKIGDIIRQVKIK
jgi:tripartite-type tricarboxylate transporter receptor subunit TctC